MDFKIGSVLAQKILSKQQQLECATPMLVSDMIERERQEKLKK
jgi:hypothetical protein